MMTMIAAVAVAAAQPAGSPANPPAHHNMQMSGAEHAEHAAKKDCCCKDMANHDGQGSEHADHGAQQQ